MLVGFFSWWFAWITELLLAEWMNARERAPGRIVAEFDQAQILLVVVRRSGEKRQLSLGAAARVASCRSVVLRPSFDVVLEKHHVVVPATPTRELGPRLRYEIRRITPFTAENLFWRWDGWLKAGNKSRTDVVTGSQPDDTGPATGPRHKIPLRTGLDASRPALMELLRSVQQSPTRILIDDIRLRSRALVAHPKEVPIQASLVLYGFGPAGARAGT